MFNSLKLCIIYVRLHWKVELVTKGTALFFKLMEVISFLSSEMLQNLSTTQTSSYFSRIKKLTIFRLNICKIRLEVPVIQPSRPYTVYLTVLTTKSINSFIFRLLPQSASWRKMQRTQKSWFHHFHGYVVCVQPIQLFPTLLAWNTLLTGLIKIMIIF